MGPGQGGDVKAASTDGSTRRDCRRYGGTGGFALVVVIWAVGILTLLFMIYIVAARYRAIEAASLAQHARAEAVANIGINLAVLDLLSGAATGKVRSGRFGSNGTPAACAFADGWQLTISIADESGKIDLNTANLELIEAVIRGMKQDAGSATAVAQSIRRLREAAAETMSAPAGSSPAAFRSVLELDQVAGMVRALFREMVPLVTVQSGSAGFDPDVAPLKLLGAISPGGVALSREVARRDLPSIYIAESAGTAFLIGSVRSTASDAAMLARQRALHLRQVHGLPPTSPRMMPAKSSALAESGSPRRRMMP